MADNKKTKEEKKQPKPTPEGITTVDLSKSSTQTTTGGGSTTETEHGDKNSSTVTQTLYGYQNPDGTIDPEKKAAFDALNAQGRKELADMYEVDPTTGRYKGTPGALLGFDPETYRKEQEAKQRLERFKQKEAGWRNALGVITDIATTAAGGNVWVRQPDNVAKQAAANVEQASANINKMGTALAQAKAGREQAYLKAEKERMDKLLKANQYQVSSTHSTQGNDRQTKKVDPKTVQTQGWYQQAMKDPATGKYNIGGKTYDATTPVRVQSNGGYINFNADTKEALSYARFAIARCSEWLKAHEDERNTPKYKRSYDAIESALENVGIRNGDFDANKDRLTPEDYFTFLQNGRVFNIDNADLEFEKLYKDATGKDIRTIPVGSDDGFDPDAGGKEEPAGGM